MSTSARIACATRRPTRTRLTADATARAAERDIALLREEVAQLTEALDRRPVIDQAMGMIMALTSCNNRRAWQVLAQVSQHTNIKVRHVADQLVATTDGGPALQEPVNSAFTDATSTPAPRQG